MTEAEKEAAKAEEEGEKGVAGPLAKHPLEHRWTLWFDNPAVRNRGGGSGWGSSLRAIFTFGTVEEFWRLPARADMHLFKEGIEPKWEDPRCERGGSWTIPCQRDKAYLDRTWLRTMLALIGEQVEEKDEVCGAVVSIRPSKDRVAVWTKSADKESLQLSIGKQLKQLLDVNEKIAFSSFKDQKTRGNPEMYTV